MRSDLYNKLRPISTQFTVAKRLCRRASRTTLLPEPLPSASSFVTVSRTLPTNTIASTSSNFACSVVEGQKNFAKSETQVRSPVAHSVLQDSNELKLDQKPRQVVPQNHTVKSELLGVRFQAGELSIIRLKAQLAGVPTNTYIRAAALGSDYKSPADAGLIKALQTLSLELTRQGNNLNQIAKHLNGGKASPAEAEGFLGIIVRSHIQTHKAIRAALSAGKEPMP